MSTTVRTLQALHEAQHQCEQALAELERVTGRTVTSIDITRVELAKLEPEAETQFARIVTIEMYPPLSQP